MLHVNDMHVVFMEQSITINREIIAMNNNYVLIYIAEDSVAFVFANITSWVQSFFYL